jgi:pimeloyl-ACP methyl ester carboxylesterase
MKRKQVILGKYQLSYLEEGKGKTVILIHAFPFNALMWEQQLKELGKKFHVIAPDIPSFGSSQPTPPLLIMEKAATFVSTLLDRLQVDKAAVGGLSMGGYISLAFAELYPEKIEKLILADTQAAADTPDKKEARKKTVQEIRETGSALFMERFIPSILGKTSLQDRPKVVEKVKQLVQMASPEAIVSALQGMAQRSARFHVLQRLNVPILIVVGEEDTLTPLSAARQMIRRGLHSQLQVIPKAGHLSNIENPGYFNQALLNFLRE